MMECGHSRSLVLLLLPKMPSFMGVAAVLLLLLLPFPASVDARCRVAPAMFNFGDSNSDTGGLTAALGYTFGPPYGRVFFHRATGRACDGRLVLDFFCESLNTSYLSPYLEALGSHFRKGANFAVSGSATLPRDLPFSLHIQVLQFTRFKSRSLELTTQGSRNLVNEGGFRNAIYMFDIGQNDLSAAFSNSSYAQVIGRIPSFISEIKEAIKNVYRQGGRKFWIHNTGPLGCLPQKLAMYKHGIHDLDAAGCLKPFNDAAKEFNARLESSCLFLRRELRNATIIYTDVYSIKYEIISNYSRYGFENPFLTCCGFGGQPYNYNINITCGNPGSNVCTAGTRRISWDGIHYTEDANSIVAKKILSGNYSKPRILFENFCTARRPINYRSDVMYGAKP